MPVIDARRREVFTLVDGVPVRPRAGRSARRGGDGVRRRRRAALPRAARGAGRASCRRRRRAASARARASTRSSRGDFGPVEEIEPLYLRVPTRSRALDDDDRAARPRARRPARDRGDRAPRRTRRRGRARCSRASSRSRARSASARSTLDGEDGELCGYLIVSRYVDAWHVMNIAVDPDHRGRGIATMLLERLFELTADDARRGYTLEVRVSNATAIALYERLGFEVARHPPRLLHGQPRGRADHVEGPGRRELRSQRRDPRIETSCDETGARASSTDGRATIRLERRRVAGRPARAVRRRRARRSRRGGTSSSSTPVVREALGEADATLDDVDRVAVTQGPGLIGALLVGLAAAKAIAWSRRLPLVPVDHLARARRVALPPADAARAAVPLPARERRAHAAPRRRAATPSSASLGTTLDDAAGEAFDKGARLLGLGYPGGREIDRLARDGDPDGLRLPGRARPGPRLLLLRPEDGAPLRDARASRRRSSSARRADLAASYQRAIVRALVERVRGGRGADRRRADRGRRRRRGELRAPRGARRRRPRAARALRPTTRR